MQSLRTISRLPITQVTKRAILQPTTPRKMSLFPRSFVSPGASTTFHPLFRLLDDFDQYSKSDSRNPSNSLKTPSFSPNFDVKEVANAYELHGELPGINQSDIEIEFTDNQTITIKGHTEHSFTRGSPPAGFIEEEGKGAKDHKDNNNKGTDVSKTTDKSKDKEPEAKYWLAERSIGEFSRSFTFPAPVDNEAVQASMKNGILSIIVPKAKKKESRKIAIN